MPTDAAANSQLDFEQLAMTIRACCKGGLQRLPLHEPFFDGNEWKYVKEALDSGWVSTAGEFVERLERELSAILDIPHSVAVVNGTAALHTALRLVGCEQNEEVLVPDLTFVATANAVTYCGATPHFVDISRNSLGVDPIRLERYLSKIVTQKSGAPHNKKTGARIRALIVMHALGHPVDLDPIVDICEKYKLELVEDAAQALGSQYKGKHVGSWGKVAALSFNGNKIITAGGGGAVLTKDKKLAEYAKHITTTSRLPHAWQIRHDNVGYNYRLPNLNAALALAQLEQLSRFVSQKRELARKYENAFKEMPHVSFIKEPDYAKSNYWVNAILVKGLDDENREALFRTLHEKNIYARAAWSLLHKMPCFSKAPRMEMLCAEEIEACLIKLPSGVGVA